MAYRTRNVLGCGYGFRRTPAEVPQGASWVRFFETKENPRNYKRAIRQISPSARIEVGKEESSGSV